ncbi:MAG TPA: HEAT repeat domain-containing protein [Polyangiaceae bacterium]|jgi:predicted RNA methylase
MSHFEAIRAKLKDPGFTPGRRDVQPMLELLGAAEEDEATRVIRALAKVPAAAERATADWAAATPPLRHRLVALVARARGDDSLETLAVALADADPRTRKAAARGIGRVQNTSIRERAAAVLREALSRETRPEVERAIVEALGKVGGATDASAIAAAGDERVRKQALQRIERVEARAQPARIASERVQPAPFEVELRCREGLESILSSELPDARVLGSGRVAARARSLRELGVARTWSTAALVVRRGEVAEENLAPAIASVAPLVRALSEGPVRWRVEWMGAGHRRAATRDLAERVAELAPDLVNDPVASDWEIEIGPMGVFAIPKSWDDARFSYRVADVPAASHPTLAAAIARLGGAREDDVVWDPFVGSGLELVERARLGPYRSLLGTDTDDAALAAAKKNIDAARVERATLVRADARSHAPRGVTLVLTNPPMGRRVQTGKLDELLVAFVQNVARVLSRGGRFVWITPRAKTTNRASESAGLRKTHDFVVDMRGFAANLQRFERDV